MRKNRIYLVILGALILSVCSSFNFTNVRGDTNSFDPGMQVTDYLSFGANIIDSEIGYVDADSNLDLVIGYENQITIYENTGTDFEHVWSIQTGDSGFIGDSSNITLMFNTEGRYGKQKLYAIVHTNTKSKFHKLTLKANIDNLPQ